MKILLINKFHYVVGGSETYYFALKKLLEAKGHEVIEFSMKHEKNIPSDYDRYFVDGVDYNGKMSALDKIRAAKNIVYSNEAKDKVRQLVIDTKPDIVHLNLFQHQLSPSILDVFREFDIPVVYTAHELKMICPNYRMMYRNVICEECKGGKYYKCTKNRCVKDSLSKSIVSTIEAYYHSIRKSYDVIDYIITPSEFYGRKFVEFGVAQERVIPVANFLDRETPNVNEFDGPAYYLYLGRLSEEKGILTLVDAFKELDDVLYIVGRGAEEEAIRNKIEQEGLTNIHLLGFKSGQDLIDLVGNAKAVILPSEWYENGPYSAIESLQLSRPIIGADIAGIPELIDGNGYLFESGNYKALRQKIQMMSKLSDEEYVNMTKASKALYDRKYTAEVHYAQLEKIYSKAIKKHI